MYFKHLKNARRSAKCKYNNLLNLWYNEIFIKLISIIILLTADIIALIYSWLNIEPTKGGKFSNGTSIFTWFVVLIYTAILIDTETLRGLKICFSTVLMLSYMLIQKNDFIFSITFDLLNFGVLWCAFRSKLSTKEFNDEYTDEHILPLINKDKKLLNAYSEVWNKSEVSNLRSYSGMFVTRYLIISFTFICLFIMKTIDNYTNFDKYNFSGMRNFNSVFDLNKSKSKNEFIIKIFCLSREGEFAFIQLALVTLIVGLRSAYSDNNWIKSSIFNLKKRVYVEIEENKEKRSLEAERCQGNNFIKIENETAKIFPIMGKLKSNVIFFAIIFLFGLLTSKSERFDMFSNIISVNNNIIILICILLPIVGLITEISVVRKWIIYFTFSIIMYNFNLWFDNDIIKVISSVTSGILFNVSVILFIWNQDKDFQYANKYPYTCYLLYKLIFSIGNIIGEYLMSSIISQDIHKKLLFTGIDIAIIGGIFLSTLPNSNLIPVNESDEVEWEVTY
ncbi:membrane associated protein [Cryptosporidium xiaoi]|uniref:Membrane associated protein n=1 Tax=Cryptosporidium xiaoi TaxID=659607 RepID=A0AAV9XSR4_9CRYT